VHSVFPVNHIGKILWIWITFDSLDQIFWFFEGELPKHEKTMAKLSEMDIFFSIGFWYLRVCNPIFAIIFSSSKKWRMSGVVDCLSSEETQIVMSW